MSFSLPKLPYKFSDLEPYIDTQTMEIHYTKHHQAYIDNLNKAIEGLTQFDGKAAEDILKNVENAPSELKQTIINNGGGHVNHTLYWNIMSPLMEENAPQGKFKEALDGTFGDKEKFWEAFKTKAMGVFGSGWAFLVLNKDNKLEISRQSFQNSPLLKGNVPLMGIDVWEHAYYLKYQNRKAEYIEAWKNIINWNEISAIFEKAILIP